MKIIIFAKNCSQSLIFVSDEVVQKARILFAGADENTDVNDTACAWGHCNEQPTYGLSS
jgi:hypothetical protein